MHAISPRPDPVWFYPHEEPKKIDSDDKCIVCWQKLIQQSPEDISKKTIVVHKNDQVKNGYSCAIHKEECLVDWLKINPKCPNCQSPVNTDSVFSWKDKAKITANYFKDTGKILLKDGINGGIMSLTMTIGVPGVCLLPGVLRSENISATALSVIQQLAASETVQQIIIVFFATGAIANIGLRYVHRQGWFFRRIPLD